MVVADVRGRGDSGGTFVPYRDDGHDGFDAIEWCAAQPWSTGKVATVGGSYTAKNQWLAAIEQPPHLTAMVTMVTPSDPFVEWPTGVPIPMDVSWYHFTSGHALQNLDAVAWDKVHRHLPLLTMDEAVGRPLPYWREMFEHAQLDDWWEPLRYQNKFDRVKVPVLHLSGWYDDEQVGTPLNFAGMVAHGPTEEIRKSQKLIMGPWPHNITAQPTKLGEVDFGPTARIDLPGTLLALVRPLAQRNRHRLLERAPRPHLRHGRQSMARRARVAARPGEVRQVFPAWQGPRQQPLRRRLTLVVRTRRQSPPTTIPLIPSAPSRSSPSPRSPRSAAPTTTAPSSAATTCLVYTTEPLAEDTEVTGPIRAKLFAASSARDTDFTAKLLDVWPDGFAQRLCDGMVRARFREGLDKPSLIEPGKVYAYDIDCWTTSQLFKKGHSIRLEIASTAFPKYDRNPNTGETLGKSTELKRADQTIYHDKDHPSHLLLPVVPPKP